MMTERERYKYFISLDKDYSVLQQTIMQIAEQRGISGIMNDTKWLELQNAVNELSFPPPFVVKCIGEEEEPILDKDVFWWGDWHNYYDEGMPQLLTIEYIKVRPRYLKHRGRLVEPEIIDETEKFCEILKRLNIYYEENKGTFTIYGYK